MCPRIINSNNEEGFMKSVGPYRFRSSENSTAVAGRSGSFAPRGTFTIGETTTYNLDSAFRLVDHGKEEKGLTPVERAALELSMQRHRRAYDLLAQH